MARIGRRRFDARGQASGGGCPQGFSTSGSGISPGSADLNPAPTQDVFRRAGGSSSALAEESTMPARSPGDVPMLQGGAWPMPAVFRSFSAGVRPSNVPRVALLGHRPSCRRCTYDRRARSEIVDFPSIARTARGFSGSERYGPRLARDGQRGRH